MPRDRLWTDTDREAVKLAIGDCRYDDMSDEQADAVMDALTAAGWQPIHRVYGYHVDDIPGVIPPEAVTLIYRHESRAEAGPSPSPAALDLGRCWCCESATGAAPDAVNDAPIEHVEINEGSKG